jgi:hypothetical protein
MSLSNFRIRVINLWPQNELESVPFLSLSLSPLSHPLSLLPPFSLLKIGANSLIVHKIFQ